MNTAKRIGVAASLTLALATFASIVVAFIPPGINADTPLLATHYALNEFYSGAFNAVCSIPSTVASIYETTAGTVRLFLKAPAPVQWVVGIISLLALGGIAALLVLTRRLWLFPIKLGFRLTIGYPFKGVKMLAKITAKRIFPRKLTPDSPDAVAKINHRFDACWDVIRELAKYIGLQYDLDESRWVGRNDVAGSILGHIHDYGKRVTRLEARAKEDIDQWLSFDKRIRNIETDGGKDHMERVILGKQIEILSRASDERDEDMAEQQKVIHSLQNQVDQLDKQGYHNSERISALFSDREKRVNAHNSILPSNPKHGEVVKVRYGNGAQLNYTFNGDTKEWTVGGTTFATYDGKSGNVILSEAPFRSPFTTLDAGAPEAIIPFKRTDRCIDSVKPVNSTGPTFVPWNGDEA